MRVDTAISIVLAFIALGSCLVALKSGRAADRSATAAETSANTAAATLKDVRDAERAKRERAEYLSYKVGLDLGLHRELGRYVEHPSLGSRALYRRHLTMATASVRAEALGLGIDMQSSADSTSVDDLIRQVKMLVRDLCGEDAHQAYVLGVNVGQAEGILWPWSGGSKAMPLGTAPDDELTEKVDTSNAQLKLLGFEQRIELPVDLSRTSYEHLNELDRSLTEAWKLEEGRWRRETQSVGSEEATDE